MAVCFYLGGTDWPHNNIKSFRNRQGGRFRYILYDTPSIMKGNGSKTSLALSVRCVKD